jgi:deoxyadenosine/deoxycytidine kinase
MANQCNIWEFPNKPFQCRQSNVNFSVENVKSSAQGCSLMGKLIAIIGNCGTGKTTLAQALCENGPYTALLEQHKERPYQAQFSNELQRFSLSNQFDYMLFRAEQEINARSKDIVGVQDGGLDQDFHVFTRLFQRKGYLDQGEFQLCERLYSALRRLLPYPDLFIKLSAPKPILVERRAKRKRNLDIVVTEDLEEIELLIQDWLPKMGPAHIISIDTREDDPACARIIESLVDRVGTILNRG